MRLVVADPGIVKVVRAFILTGRVGWRVDTSAAHRSGIRVELHIVSGFRHLNDLDKSLISFAPPLYLDSVGRYLRLPVALSIDHFPQVSSKSASVPI